MAFQTGAVTSILSTVWPAELVKAIGRHALRGINSHLRCIAGVLRLLIGETSRDSAVLLETCHSRVSLAHVGRSPADLKMHAPMSSSTGEAPWSTYSCVFSSPPFVRHCSLADHASTSLDSSGWLCRSHWQLMKADGHPEVCLHPPVLQRDRPDDKRGGDGSQKSAAARVAVLWSHD